ncbi:hypothetical protein ACVCII_03955 [Burkholderia glumae]|uniref:hypothetical protein n=1 Tax=Burkholderia glumae TaxID=337 RepID=UPI00203759ED|nr:hypothetical protein [Burkholderia glumae]MCM2546210.1 hypothetical protein [Burkholderia glumae]
MLKVTPICRYGHGELERVNGPETPDGTKHAWGLLGFVIQPYRAADEFGGEQLSKVMSESMGIFTASVYRCPVCGYVEMFDDGEENVSP